MRGRNLAFKTICPDRITRKRLWTAARDAVSRCTDKTDACYYRYGERGIKVHPEWVADIIAFATYLVTLPGHDDTSLVLDRINNDGSYEPGNLRFTTKSESSRNQNRTRPCRARGSVTRLKNNRWQAQMKANGKYQYLGTFGSREDAEARVAAKRVELGLN